ncbi:hypothetical protein D6T64_19470 [Cryobacterium melibiosiphilum]|uniref:Uncharacterized protein n=1 Tax=Cryobacterium melibiosiphilum TaxID=995039 RepID=A0A3A5M845_9MICO|nr:hypothetical protein [Cryobacterium melibiosiphilum]RJT85123.1 hypothetical protein D6T64_19470 [Cryobacterium melibiosiphilum]
MPLSLAAVIAAPPTGRPRAVLVDSHDYAQAVLLQGKPVPWGEPMAYCNFFGQAQGLLASDLALLSLDRFYAYRLQSDAALRETMAAKSRTGFALRTLLGDAELLADAVDFATTFSKTQRAPVVLQIPSPMQWLARTHGFSGATHAAGLDADNAENASMYVADWLRAFAVLPLASVLLDDRPLPGDDATVAVPLETYSPVRNVTDHYGWTLGLRGSDGVRLSVPSGGEERAGVVIPPAFWPGSSVEQPPAGEFLLAEIPSTAVPEHVLARLATLG